MLNLNKLLKMAHHEKGRIVFVDEVRRGISTRTGESWESLDFVLETDERFPRKVKFNLFGARKVQLAQLKLGEVVDVYFYPESQEYNGHWYTELRVGDIYNLDGTSRTAPVLINLEGQ